MSDSKDKKVSPADEIKYMGALKNKMIVGDYNRAIASMREIAAIEQARENKDLEEQQNPEK